MNRRISTSISLSCLAIILFLFQLVSAKAQSFENKGHNQIFKQSKFLFSVDGGLGYLIGNTKDAKNQMSNYGISDSDADDYYNRLKLGEHGGVSMYYYFFPELALGVDYNLFTTSSSVNGFLDPGDGWTHYYGPFEEKIYTSFVGLSVFQTQKLNEKWGMYGKFSLGAALYRNESLIIISPLLITGKAPAVKGEFGFSYRLTDWVKLNAGVSYMFSSLQKITVDDGINSSEIKLEGDSKENISRLNLSTGLQFSF